MFPLVLSAYLFTNTIQPLSLAWDVLPAGLKRELTDLEGLICGRVLASFVEKGMSREEVVSILGTTRLILWSGLARTDVYFDLGVRVTYMEERYKVAGEKEERSELVVTGVKLAPLINFSGWLRWAGPPAPR